MEPMEDQKSRRVIMVAIDETEMSISALQWALNNLFASDDRIILVHAQRSPISYFATGSSGLMVPAEVLQTLENDIKKSTEKFLAKAREICKAKNVTPEIEIQTGEARVVLGSVSDYCVHHVQCPAVVVKPKKEQAH